MEFADESVARAVQGENSSEIRVMFMRRRPPVVKADANGDRRSTCRYAASRRPVEIGWWDGPEFITTTMALRDISLSGASAITEKPIPPAAPIWLRLTDPAHPDWVEATILDVAARRRGPSLVRIKFQGTCHYEFFKAMIRGIVTLGEDEGPVPTNSQSTYWKGRYWT